MPQSSHFQCITSSYRSGSPHDADMLPLLPLSGKFPSGCSRHRSHVYSGVRHRTAAVLELGPLRAPPHLARAHARTLSRSLLLHHSVAKVRGRSYQALADSSTHTFKQATNTNIVFLATHVHICDARGRARANKHVR